MGNRKKKRSSSKKPALTEKSGLSPLGYWHQDVQNLPDSKFQLAYLSTLDVGDDIPIAFCSGKSIDKIEDFKPCYLQKVSDTTWNLLDLDKTVMSDHQWENTDDCISNNFGSWIQHPHEKFVKHFLGISDKVDIQPTSKSIRQDPIERWHQSLMELPKRSTFDITLLRTVAIGKGLPIAFCRHGDLDNIEHFEPCYLHRRSETIWDLLDIDQTLLSVHEDNSDKSVSLLLGTFMQHPDDIFVKHFVGASEEVDVGMNEGPPPRRVSPRQHAEKSKEVIDSGDGTSIRSLGQDMDRAELPNPAQRYEISFALQ